MDTKQRAFIRKAMEYTDEILELVQHAEEMTTSGFQGATQALATKIMRENSGPEK